MDAAELEQRAVGKFYTRVRLSLDDIEPVPEGTKKDVTEKLKHLQDEEKYGLIKRTELEMLLLNYDETSEKSTKCDRILAGSFAKLLYSKPGFHNPSSTDFLVEDLDIKDHNRDSFLGGHSTYSTPPEVSLRSILEHHGTLYIKNRARELLDEIDDLDTDRTTLETDCKELFDMDTKNGNNLAVSGKFWLRFKNYRRAVDDLRSALQSNCDYVDRVKPDLAEACYREGLDIYNRRSYQQACELFQESLSYNPDHNGSRLHIGLVAKKIQEQNRRFGEQPNTFMTRRR